MREYWKASRASAASGVIALLISGAAAMAADAGSTGDPAGDPAVAVSPTPSPKVSPAAKAMPKITVEVTAVALSTVPDPRSIAPYVECLSCNRYRVTKVVSTGAGWPDDARHRLVVGQEVQVLQWGVLKSKKTALADAKVGDVRTMAIQDSEDTPQFDELDRSCSIDWDVDMVTLYEPELATSPGVTAEKPAKPASTTATAPATAPAVPKPGSSE